jgi:hypothetical protein
LPIPTDDGFANVDDASFELLPAGTYNAVVASHQVNPAGPNAKYPNSQVVNWEFNLTDEGYENRKQWYNTTLADTAPTIEDKRKALGMLKSVLKAFGETDETLSVPGFEVEPESYYGVAVKLVVNQYEYPKGSNNGQPNKNGVQSVLPGGEASSSGAPLP